MTYTVASGTLNSSIPYHTYTVSVYVSLSCITKKFENGSRRHILAVWKVFMKNKKLFTGKMNLELNKRIMKYLL